MGVVGLGRSPKMPTSDVAPDHLYSAPCVIETLLDLMFLTLCRLMPGAAIILNHG